MLCHLSDQTGQLHHPASSSLEMVCLEVISLNCTPPSTTCLKQRVAILVNCRAGSQKPQRTFLFPGTSDTKTNPFHPPKNLIYSLNSTNIVKVSAQQTTIQSLSKYPFPAYFLPTWKPTRKFAQSSEVCSLFHTDVVKVTTIWQLH